MYRIVYFQSNWLLMVRYARRTFLKYSVANSICVTTAPNIIAAWARERGMNVNLYLVGLRFKSHLRDCVHQKKENNKNTRTRCVTMIRSILWIFPPHAIDRLSPSRALPNYFFRQLSTHTVQINNKRNLFHAIFFNQQCALIVFPFSLHLFSFVVLPHFARCYPCVYLLLFLPFSLYSTESFSLSLCCTRAGILRGIKPSNGKGRQSREDGGWWMGLTAVLIVNPLLWRTGFI